MPRLLFEKTGNAVWISHLDLMRLFQRAFKRAGLHLTHTQGYNPRPSVSIALPLSVGVESFCELLDFELDGDLLEPEEIKDRLNFALVSGIRVLTVYNNGRKLRDLSLLNSTLSLEYDNGIPGNAETVLNDLFSSQQLMVVKRTKNGEQQQDIIPMIRRISVCRAVENELRINLWACCQNPTLNPMQIVTAIQTFVPEVSPNFVRIQRNEIYDAHETVFR